MPHADLVLQGGRIFTGLQEGFVEALAVADGRVLAAGPAAQVAALIGPATRVVALDGRLAVPGFNDAHQHLSLLGLGLLELNLRADNGVSSVDELLARVAAEAARKPPGEWITGRGYDQNELREGRHPTRDELDRVAPQHPVFLKRACGHIAVANSRALAAGGITVDTPDPQGGLIERRDGRLTGLLAETARRPVLAAKPKPGRADLVAAIEAAGRFMLSQGYTSTSDMAVGVAAGFDDVRAYEEAAAGGRLPLRTWLVLNAELDGPSVAQQAWDAGLRFGRELGLLRYGGVKLFVDGTAGGATAAVSEPYVDQPDNHGLFTYDDATLQAGLQHYHDLGYQLAVHAIGDAGIEQVLSGLERIAERSPVRDRRHRIEHCGFVTDAQIARMARSGVLPGAQPIFVYEFGDLYAKLLGEARAEQAYPMRKFWDAGLQPSASSDAPVSSTDPFRNLYAMTTRRTVHGTLRGPAQRLSLAEALHALSYNGAVAAFAEQDLGRLLPGQRADIAVLSQDLFAAEPLSLRDDTRCDLTILDGRVVYERPGAAA